MAVYKNTGLRSNGYAEEVGEGRIILSHDEASGCGRKRPASLLLDGLKGRADDHPERNGMRGSKEQARC
jgi:hypothetical protein